MNLRFVGFLIFTYIFCVNLYAANLYDDSSNEVAGISNLMNAAANNDNSAIEFFTKSNQDSINKQNLGGASALHIAARTGNYEIVKMLLDSGANLNLVDNEGWTPLMRACLAKSSDIVDALINKGASADIRNSFGETAIIHAASSGCSRCLDIMFEKYDFTKSIDQRILKEQLVSALSIAQLSGYEDSQDMITRYISLVNSSNTYKQSESSIADLAKIENSTKNSLEQENLQPKIIKNFKILKDRISNDKEKVAKSITMNTSDNKSSVDKKFILKKATEDQKPVQVNSSDVKKNDNNTISLIRKPKQKTNKTTKLKTEQDSDQEISEQIQESKPSNSLEDSVNSESLINSEQKKIFKFKRSE